MHIRNMIERIASDFDYVTIVQSINGINTTYLDQSIYHNAECGAWPYVFYPCSERAIDFDIEHITQIVIGRAGVCVYIYQYPLVYSGILVLVYHRILAASATTYTRRG